VIDGDLADRRELLVAALAGAVTVAFFAAVVCTFGFSTEPDKVGQTLSGIGVARTLGYEKYGAAGMATLFIRGMLCNWMVSAGVVGAMISTTVPGKVIRKFGEDNGPNQAIVLAWNVLFSIFPIVLAMAAIPGLILSHAGVKSDAIYQSVLSLMPSDAHGSAQGRDGLEAARAQRPATHHALSRARGQPGPPARPRGGALLHRSPGAGRRAGDGPHRSPVLLKRTSISGNPRLNAQ